MIMIWSQWLTINVDCLGRFTLDNNAEPDPVLIIADESSDDQRLSGIAGMEYLTISPRPHATSQK